MMKVFLLLQALAGEVGMDNELDEVAKALFNGQLPASWRKLAPATLKNLGGWMDHFIKRHHQYLAWVSVLQQTKINNTIYQSASITVLSFKRTRLNSKIACKIRIPLFF